MRVHHVQTLIYVSTYDKTYHACTHIFPPAALPSLKSEGLFRVAQYMVRIDQIIEQSLERGHYGEDLAHASVLVPRTEVEAV